MENATPTAMEVEPEKDSTSAEPKPVVPSLPKTKEPATTNEAVKASDDALPPPKASEVVETTKPEKSTEVPSKAEPKEESTPSPTEAPIPSSDSAGPAGKPSDMTSNELPVKDTSTNEASVDAPQEKLPAAEKPTPLSAPLEETKADENPSKPTIEATTNPLDKPSEHKVSSSQATSSPPKPSPKVVPKSTPPTNKAAAPVKVKTTKVTKQATKAAKGATSTVTSKKAGDTKSLKKGARKKRKNAGIDESSPEDKKKKKVKRKKEKEDEKKLEKAKKPRKQTKKTSSGAMASSGYSYADQLLAPPGMSPAQLAVQEQMRRALEEDQYSANGSIVDTDSDDDEHQYTYKGHSIRLDRAHLLQAAKKYSWLGDGSAIAVGKAKANKNQTEDPNDDPMEVEEEGILNEDGTTNNAGSTNTTSKKKSSRSSKGKRGRNQYTNKSTTNSATGSSGGFRIDDPNTTRCVEVGKPKHVSEKKPGEVVSERDEGSIFGQTTGSSNSTWVECDKCKKWRRLRGVVDERKLPPKWYCSMNKNDPERARCSAPEEEYDSSITPESAADARTRKHLRVWVRRLQCNEQYESKMPTLTRNKKRLVASSSKEPHEWIRCCNPSCGKWRAILRIMDAKQNVMDNTLNGEWYCVMNTWDEKTASCAAPQENLPAVGCPPWVLQDDH